MNWPQRLWVRIWRKQSPRNKFSQPGRLKRHIKRDDHDHEYSYFAYQYLIAAEVAEKAGRPQPLWRAMGLGLCDFFAEHALPNAGHI